MARIRVEALRNCHQRREFPHSHSVPRALRYGPPHPWNTLVQSSLLLQDLKSHQLVRMLVGWFHPPPNCMNIVVASLARRFVERAYRFRCQRAHSKAYEMVGWKEEDKNTAYSFQWEGEGSMLCSMDVFHESEH